LSQNSPDDAIQASDGMDIRRGTLDARALDYDQWVIRRREVALTEEVGKSGAISPE
jgi:hypothetical protein